MAMKRFFARQSVTPGDFMDWREQAGDAFSRLAALEWWDPAYSHDGPPQQLAGFRVTASLFDILGVRAELGRTLLESDAAGDAAVAVLSHDFWVRQFGSRADVIGKTVWLDTKPHRVVGVMPPTFTVPFGAEVWAPLPFTPEARADRNDQHLMVVAQLAPGVSAEGSEQRLLAILAQQKKGVSGDARQARSQRAIVHRRLRRPGLGPVHRRLAGGVAPAAARGMRERGQPACWHATPNGSARLAVRLALGASARPHRLAASARSARARGCCEPLSLPLIWAGLRAIRVSMPDAVIRFVQGINYMEVQPATLLATTLLAVCATVIAAMIPALRACRGSVVESLRPGTRVSDGASRQRGRAVLATAQIALTLALLATAGLSLLGVVSREQRADRVRHRGHPDRKRFTAGHALRGGREAAPVHRFRAPATLGAAVGRRRGRHHEPAV
jgi:putative ABC transport system permease protein